MCDKYVNCVCERGVEDPNEMDLLNAKEMKIRYIIVGPMGGDVSFYDTIQEALMDIDVCPSGSSIRREVVLSQEVYRKPLTEAELTALCNAKSDAERWDEEQVQANCDGRMY